MMSSGPNPPALPRRLLPRAKTIWVVPLNLFGGGAKKPGTAAGLFDARRQVEYLERNKLMFLGSGLTDPDVSLAASLLLFGAYGLKYPAALNGPRFLAGSFLKQPFQVEGGALRVR